MLLPEGVRIGERVTCPSLGSPDGVAPDSEARHVSSGGGVPTGIWLLVFLPTDHGAHRFQNEMGLLFNGSLVSILDGTLFWNIFLSMQQVILSIFFVHYH